jgi:hypothetical protein
MPPSSLATRTQLYTRTAFKRVDVSDSSLTTESQGPYKLFEQFHLERSTYIAAVCGWALANYRPMNRFGEQRPSLVTTSGGLVVQLAGGVQIACQFALAHGRWLGAGNVGIAIRIPQGYALPEPLGDAVVDTTNSVEAPADPLAPTGQRPTAAWSIATT